MGGRRRSTVLLFIFLISWSGTYLASGGLFRNLTGFLRYAVHLKVSFVTTGLCLYIYLYILRPAPREREDWGIGIRVVKCIVLACLLKCKSPIWKNNKGWLDSTEGKCEKSVIGKTKQLLLIYAIFLPTISYSATVVVDSSLFFGDFYDSIKRGWLANLVGIPTSMRITYIISAAVTFFCILPLLRYSAFLRSSNNRYIFGAFISVFSMFYVSFTFNKVEGFHYSSTSGIVRIYNTANETVTFHSHDRLLTSNLHRIDIHDAREVAYSLDETALFLADIEYENSGVNFSVFLSITPGEATGYVLLEPPDIIRIPGHLPIREGPPGTYEKIDPRLYLFNSAKTLLNSWFTINRHDHQEVIKKYRLNSVSKMVVFNLVAGVYDFSIKEADIVMTKRVEDGGIYAIIVYSNSTSRSIAIDDVKGGNTYSDRILVPYGVLYGVSFSCAYVALKAMVYSIAPPGLMGMSFSYISLLEHMSGFMFYVGFQTWHQIVSANTFFTYTFFMASGFFITLYVFVKYRNICDF